MSGDTPPEKLEYARKALMREADKAELEPEMRRCHYRARKAYSSYMNRMGDETIVDSHLTLREGLEIAESRLENLKNGYCVDGSHYDDSCVEDPLVEDLQQFVESYRELASYLDDGENEEEPSDMPG